MAHHVETSFYHPQLRRLTPPGQDNADVSYLRETVLGKWVRVVLTDGRAFCGVLEAVDGALNLVVANPVEVRPVKDDSAPPETKGHRGCIMVSGKHVVSLGLYDSV